MLKFPTPIIGGLFLNILVNILKKATYKQIVSYIILILSFTSSVLFVNHNYSFYDRSIAEVMKTTLEDTTDITDMHKNEDQLFTQHIVAVLKNGEEKGKEVFITNEFSSSGAYDQEYHVGDEVFVSNVSSTIENEELTGNITDVKRDKHVLLIAWIFIFTLLIVGKRQGLFSILSLAINVFLLSFALDVYIKHPNVSLLLICGAMVLLFTVISMLFVNGFNEKTYAAIAATIAGTFASLLIAYFVIWATSENGLRYEEMQFLTRPYKMIFMAGLLIGSLGAVMDVAITMSSSIFALYDQNNKISAKELKASGIDIGKDIMGTITNILFFAYISGSIPILILYLKNASPLGFTLSMNLSLELARALVGGIGIVLTIPIGLYTSIFFVNRKRAKL